MITSATNEQIKNIIQLKEKAKVRKKTGTFVVEGIKMFQEIPEEDRVATYVSEQFEQEHRDLLRGIEYQVVSDQVFKKISDTVTPQGVLSVVRMRKNGVEDVLGNRNPDKNCIVVLERLQDPGNLGTILRTGEGAGICGLIMSPDCVDIYSPKVIRSTMGSIFRVPFAIVDLDEAMEQLKEHGFITYAAHLKGELYSNGTLAKDCAFLIGNEARGLSDELSSKADRKIKIPMAGKVESLNAAVATLILMYAHQWG